ncbi:MAG: hypothetical protein ACC742_06705 [Thermoanaerobaculales bacterium]
MSTTLPISEARSAVLLLGLATAVAQALLLREAMAAMGGSEMAWGTVMALWLVGMSIGARIGVHTASPLFARLAPVLVIALAGGGIVLFRAAPALGGATAGESITTLSVAWLWVVAVLPAAVAGGFAFPLLAEKIGGPGGGRAYALEASGALLGGVLLSLALLWLGTAAAISLGVGIVAAGSLWRRNRAIACLLAAAGALVALPSGEILARAGWHWAAHPGKLRAWRETRLQRIEVADGFPTSVFADGRLLGSYPDPYTVLPRAHLVMLLHPDPRRVLVIGSVADGSVEAMAQHPVEELVVVEEDPELLRLLPEWYGPRMAAALAAPRVKPLVADPLRAVSEGSPWDLIILRDGDPTTLRRNRTRTLEFLRRCRSRLKPDGVLVVRVGVSDTYLGGAGGRLLAVLAQTIRDVFPRLSAIPGEEILLVAGGQEAGIELDPEVLARRLTDRGLEDSELVPEMLPLLLDPDRARALQPRLLERAPPNTIQRPRAVILAGGLHEGRSHPSLVRLALLLERTSPMPLAVALSFAVIGLLLAAVRRRSPGVSTAGVVGFCSMGWWLVLVATWQATRGSVYSEIGALTAAFMGGLAGGAAIASRWRHPANRLPTVLACGVVLSILVAGGIGVWAPLFTVPVLLIAGGLLTGAAFPGMAELTAGARTRRGAGIAFAADEAGAGGAALVVGILAIPWAGLAATAAGLALLQLAAVPAVVAALRRQ